MNIYNFENYKNILKHVMHENQGRGYQKKLSEAAGCKSSYLSKVINSYYNLTPEHALNLCHFWGFDDLEVEYFLTLVDMERAGSSKLESHLKIKLNQIKQKKDDLANTGKRELLESSEILSSYYSSWIYSAIHILLSVNVYRSPDSLSKKLNLPKKQVVNILNELKRFGFVNNKNNIWSYTKGSVHVHKDSPYVSLHHQNWRQRAVLSSSNKTQQNKLHFTSVMSLGLKDFENLKDDLNDFIKMKLKETETSPEEEVACLNLDFFMV